MSSLIRGNELELAACVGLVLGEAASQSTTYCLELLAKKYMTTPTWYVSVHEHPVREYSIIVLETLKVNHLTQVECWLLFFTLKTCFS